MPAQPKSVGVEVASRREILLAEAIRLFRRNGYHSVSIDDIGRAAGINASSVYRHFAGKADLLAAAYYRAAERLAAGTTSSLSEAEDLPDALRRQVDGYVDLALQHPDLIIVYLAENNNLPDDDRHELRKLQRLQVEEWVQLLVGIRPEIAATDARVLVHAALNLITDLGASAGRSAPGGLNEALAQLALAVLCRA